MNSCSYDNMTHDNIYGPEDGIGALSEGEIPDATESQTGAESQASGVERCDFISVHEDVVNKVMQQMAPETKLLELADFFKVFADTTRIKILYVLRCSEMCVCDLASILGMTQSAISHQLRTLKHMGLVKNRRDGKTVFYSLSDGHIQTILDQGMDHINENY